MQSLFCEKSLVEKSRPFIHLHAPTDQLAHSFRILADILKREGLITQEVFSWSFNLAIAFGCQLIMSWSALLGINLYDSIKKDNVIALQSNTAALSQLMISHSISKSHPHIMRDIRDIYLFSQLHNHRQHLLIHFGLEDLVATH